MQNATKEIELEEGFQEGDLVIVDKGTISEQRGTINFFFGNDYCEVKTDFCDNLPVHINRLSRTKTFNF